MPGKLSALAMDIVFGLIALMDILCIYGLIALMEHLLVVRGVLCERDIFSQIIPDWF